MIQASVGRFQSVLCLSLVLCLPAGASAGTFPYWGVSFGTPARTAAQVGLSFGNHVPTQSDEGVSIGTGPVIEATIGMGAGKLGIGRSILILTDQRKLRVFADVKAVATRSWEETRGASSRATYLGVEGGLSVSFVRFSLGLSKRLQHRDSGANVLFTWGAGVQIRMGSGRARNYFPRPAS